MRTLVALPFSQALECLGALVASKIVDQYIKAAGGAKGISKIQTLAIEGTFTFDTKLPNRYFSELVAGDKSWIEAYNRKPAWHENGAGEVATFLGRESSQLEDRRAVLQRPPAKFEKNKLALSLVGHAQVRGKEAWQIDVTAANGMKRQVYFDAALTPIRLRWRARRSMESSERASSIFRRSRRCNCRT